MHLSITIVRITAMCGSLHCTLTCAYVHATFTRRRPHIIQLVFPDHVFLSRCCCMRPHLSFSLPTTLSLDWALGLSPRMIHSAVLLRILRTQYHSDMSRVIYHATASNFTHVLDPQSTNMPTSVWGWYPYVPST